jgi:hypothetical protein
MKPKKKLKVKMWVITQDGCITRFMGSTKTKAIDYLLTGKLMTWKDFLGKGYRAVKVRVEEV